MLAFAVSLLISKECCPINYPGAIDAHQALSRVDRWAATPRYPRGKAAGQRCTQRGRGVQILHVRTPRMENIAPADMLTGCIPLPYKGPAVLQSFRHDSCITK